MSCEGRASSGRFGIGNLTVGSGLTASIRHTAGSALGRQAYVFLNGTTGGLSIASGATETVARLYLNGVQQPAGTYNSGRITGGGSLVVGEIAPNAPTALTANGNSAVSVQLAWTHASVNDTAIKVERSLSAGSGFAEIASLAGSARSHEDTGLAPNTTYYYRVRAVNAAGNSPYSSGASAITLLPAAPTGLSATAGPGQVALSWNGSTGASSYVVRRSTNSGGPYTDVATPSATSYLNGGLLDVTYYYVVAAVAPNGGIGTQSAEVSATPTLADSNGVWNVASGGDWMTSGNWLSSIVAIGVDRSASFPLAAGGAINQNRAGLTLGALSFTNGNYTLTGNPLTLDVTTGAPTVSVGPGVTATISTALNGSDGMAKTGAGTLTLTAYNNYTGGTTVSGGTLELAGATGGWGLLRGAATVNSGATLALTGGDGSGFGWNDPITSLTVNGGTVNAPGGAHIGFGAGITVALNNGGTITGIWQWNGGAITFSSSGNSTNTISGSFNLRGDGGPNHTFAVADGTAATDLQVSATLSDQYPEIWWLAASNLIKTGAGTMVLSGNNSYDGNTTINGGTLEISPTGKLYGAGYVNTPVVTVSSGTTLRLSGWNYDAVGSLGDLDFSRNLLVVNGGTIEYAGTSNSNDSGAGRNFTVGTGGATLKTTTAGQTWTLSERTDYGDLINANGLTVGGAGNGVIGKVISGTGALTKTDAGTWTLTAVNTYTGGTIVNAGNLILANGNAGGWGRISGALTINSGATVETTGDGTGLGWVDQISSVALNGGTLTSAGTIHVWNIPGGITMTGGTLQSNNGTSDPSGPQLEWNRTAVTTLASANTATIAGRIRIRGDNSYAGLTFNVADGAAATDLLVSAAVTEANAGRSLTKTGAGTLTLSGANSYTGNTTINGGTLLVTGSIASSATTVQSGATFGGTGSAGNVTLNSGATLAPGAGGIGTLSAASVTLSGTMAVEISAAASDRLNASGSVTLSGPLAITAQPGIAPGTAFTILSKTSAGAVSGTFAGKPQGSAFNASGYLWVISYTGGDGNDVTLTTATAQQSWRFTHFGTVENTGTAADSFDVNGDGESNLMEFATGQTPNAATTAAPALVKNGATLELTYTRAHAAMNDGVTFTPEWRDNLAAGVWSSAGVTEQILTDNGTVQTVKASVAAGASSRFLHLKISKP